MLFASHPIDALRLDVKLYTDVADTLHTFSVTRIIARLLANFLLPFCR